MKIHRFEDLECWQEARRFANTVYALTSNGSFKSDYALRDQVRRASISVMANIAEGFGRNSDKEFLRFLDISRGSLFETTSHLYLALDQGYLQKQEFDATFAKSEEIAKKINALIRYLSNSVKADQGTKTTRATQTTKTNGTI